MKSSSQVAPVTGLVCFVFTFSRAGQDLLAGAFLFGCPGAMKLTRTSEMLHRPLFRNQRAEDKSVCSRRAVSLKTNGEVRLQQAANN